MKVSQLIKELESIRVSFGDDYHVIGEVSFNGRDELYTENDHNRIIGDYTRFTNYTGW